jgi:hypothetical protein
MDFEWCCPKCGAGNTSDADLAGRFMQSCDGCDAEFDIELEVNVSVLSIEEREPDEEENQDGEDDNSGDDDGGEEAG